MQYFGEEVFRPFGLRIGEKRFFIVFDNFPSSIKITRLATLRAKPISWVTTIMVILR
jgi:hypothetical protein